MSLSFSLLISIEAASRVVDCLLTLREKGHYLVVPYLSFPLGGWNATSPENSYVLGLIPTLLLSISQFHPCATQVLPCMSVWTKWKDRYIERSEVMCPFKQGLFGCDTRLFLSLSYFNYDAYIQQIF